MSVELFYIILLVEHGGHVGLALHLLVAPHTGAVLGQVSLGPQVEREVYHPLLTVKILLLTFRNKQN